MDTRVLTLFDDEDFFPREEPKKKPRKETALKDVKNQEQPEQDSISAVTENKNDVTMLPDTVQEQDINPEHKVVDQPENKAPEIEVPEQIISGQQREEINASEEIFGEEESIEEEEIVAEGAIETEVPEFDDPETEVEAGDESTAFDTEKEATDIETQTADEELNKQILSELIQMDYTALIHRDYPFDINKASVVEKSKSVAYEAPAPEQEAIGEEEDDEVFEDIVPLPEWNLDKKYYTIGEVAQLFAVNTSHIRFWTNEFKLKPRTTRKGDRLYNPKDIAELRLIHHLVKEKKHTIKGAKEKLKAGKNDVNNKLDLKDSLTNLRDTLLQIKAHL